MKMIMSILVVSTLWATTASAATSDIEKLFEDQGTYGEATDSDAIRQGRFVTPRGVFDGQ